MRMVLSSFNSLFPLLQSPGKKGKSPRGKISPSKTPASKMNRYAPSRASSGRSKARSYDEEESDFEYYDDNEDEYGDEDVCGIIHYSVYASVYNN